MCLCVCGGGGGGETGGSFSDLVTVYIILPTNTTKAVLTICNGNQNYGTFPPLKRYLYI